jgi:uncharacterized OB-fold protein
MKSKLYTLKTMNTSSSRVIGICKGCGAAVIPSWHWCEKCTAKRDRVSREYHAWLNGKKRAKALKKL